LGIIAKNIEFLVKIDLIKISKNHWILLSVAAGRPSQILMFLMLIWMERYINNQAIELTSWIL
jgi:hypothetical protein